MIYVFPVSLHDKHLIDPLCDVIAHLGGMKKRKVLVVGDLQADHAVQWMATQLSKLDAIVSFKVFPIEAREGWPKACNKYFVSTMSYLAKEARNAEPIFWMELDNTPIKTGWLDKIESEYGLGCSQNKPFMGVLRDYYDNRRGPLALNGQIMNGSGVYPAAYFVSSQLMMTALKETRPWDIYMRWEIAPHAHDASSFICLNWVTTNYRYEGGKIKCDIGQRPAQILTGDKVTEINDGHFIVHGCKDSSLAKLIMGEQASKPQAQEAAKGTSAADWQKSPTIAPQAQESTLIEEGEITPQTFSLKEELAKLEQKENLKQAKVKEGEFTVVEKPAVRNERSSDKASPLRKKRNKKLKVKRKPLNLSPEERQRRSDHAKNLHAARKAKKPELATAA